jgi:polyisoprenyl-teichoic acid--peptidoglycan teichoic acid transferase
MESTQQNPISKEPASQEPLPISASKLKITLLVLFVIAAALTAYLTFRSVRDFVTSWELTGLPGIKLQPATPTPNPAVAVIENPQAPLQPVGGPTPQPWDGAKRVTILIMGLDYRDWTVGEGPPRTDTMILLTLDPVNHTAGMLSIPRDLWVYIPGAKDYGKINTAYQLGEAWKLPGGGPGLAMKTVEDLLGVPIDYYAQIDFSAFVQFIDDIGGVKIDIPEKITVDPITGSNHNTVNLKPGRQVLSGDLALAYARVRKNAGDDFGRAERQQQIVLGIRDRVVDFNQLPTLISKAPILYSELSSGIHTNLSLEDAIKLAWLGSQIQPANIKKAIIGPEQVNFQTSPDGLDVLKPLPDKIREVRDEIFTDSGPASPGAANMDPTERLKEEAARVSVLNGTLGAGLATQTQQYLQKQGINVTEAGNASQVTTYTEITIYTGKPYTVQYLVDLLKIDPIRIHEFYDPTKPVDIVVTLGSDWANKNPMP